MYNEKERRTYLINTEKKLKFALEEVKKKSWSRQKVIERYKNYFMEH